MKKLIRLTQAEIDMITKADDMMGNNSYDSSATRIYSIARNRKNDDIAFILVAVANIKKRLDIKPVAITSVDSEFTYFSAETNIVCGNCFHGNYFKVGWREVNLAEDGKTLPYAAYGKFYWYNHDCIGKVWKETSSNVYWVLKRPLNINEVISTNSRFKYSSLPKWGENALEWLKKYEDYKEIENFSKMDISRLAIPNFIKSLRKDRGLLKYLISNIDDIRNFGYGQNDIRYGYKHGMPLSEVRAIRAKQSRVRAVKKEMREREVTLPDSFDFERLAEYLDKNSLNNYEYARYIKHCIRGGADVLDENTAFPPNLERRLAHFDKAEQTKTLEDTNKALSKFAEDYVRALKGMRMGDYTVVIPKNCKEFANEGKAMSNCIGGGSYSSRMANGKCVCVFIRLKSAPDKPFVDCEIVNGKVKQCYCKNNARTDEKTEKFANKIAKRLFKTAA